MRELIQSDILPIIVNYLEEIGYQKIAKKIVDNSGIANLEKNKFTNKKIQDILNYYIQNKPKLQSLFEDNIESEESELKIKIKNKKKRKISKESINIEVKESKKKNQKKKYSIDIIDENDNDIKRKSSKDLQLNTEKKQVKQEIKTNDEYVHENSSAKFFQKIDYSRVDQLDQRLLDNTFEAKEKYGFGDEFGKLGNQKLAPTRGKDFRKEKNKLKNKQFAGGDFKINTHQINGIKL